MMHPKLRKNIMYLNHLKVNIKKSSAIRIYDLFVGHFRPIEDPLVLHIQRWSPMKVNGWLPHCRFSKYTYIYVSVWRTYCAHPICIELVNGIWLLYGNNQFLITRSKVTILFMFLVQLWVTWLDFCQLHLPTELLSYLLEIRMS